MKNELLTASSFQLNKLLALHMLFQDTTPYTKLFAALNNESPTSILKFPYFWLLHIAEADPYKQTFLNVP